MEKNGGTDIGICISGQMLLLQNLFLFMYTLTAILIYNSLYIICFLEILKMRLLTKQHRGQLKYVVLHLLDLTKIYQMGHEAFHQNICLILLNYFMLYARCHLIKFPLVIYKQIDLIFLGRLSMIPQAELPCFWHYE